MELEGRGEVNRNLPAIVSRVGGALERVVSELELYVDERYPLDRVSLVALSRVIEQHPELNDEESVGFLVDALTYHGIGGRQRKQFFELVDQYGADKVAIALEYLLAAGYRDRGPAAQSRDPKNSLRYVKAVLRRIGDLESRGRTVGGEEELDSSDWEVTDYLEPEDFVDD